MLASGSYFACLLFTFQCGTNCAGGEQQAPEQSEHGERSRGERGDRRPKGGGRNRGGQGPIGSTSGDRNWNRAQGGGRSYRTSRWPLILGQPPQVRLDKSLPGAAEQCVLCREEQPSYVSIGRCRHAEVCWVCTLRLRFLNQDTRCPLCNEELGEVLLTTDRNASMEPIDLLGLNHEHPWIYFADETIRRAVLQLLGYRCEIEGCEKKDVAFRSLKTLEDHLWHTHWRQLCKVCLHDRPAFICEQRVYDSSDMDRHNREGDTSWLSKEQDAMPTVPPHPRCEFCKQRFFNDDNLLMHMNLRHVQCQICDTLGYKNEFFLNPKCLSRHWEEKHHVCAHKDCATDGYRQTAFAEEKALMDHYERVHKQKFADEKARGRVMMGSNQEDTSAIRRRRGRGAEDLDPIQFRWPTTAIPEDYNTDATEEDYRYNRFPNRLIIPLTRGSEGKGWRPKENGEEGEPDAPEAEGEEQEEADKEEFDLHPELEKLGIDRAISTDGPRAGAPSCLSALHSALRALVPEDESQTEGWDAKLLPAVGRLKAAEVENLECMRVHLHDEADENSLDWEPLERLLGLRPLLFRLLRDKGKAKVSSQSRRAIGPRQGGTTEEQEEDKAWREWKQKAQAVIDALAPKAQQRVLRYVELCMQRRTALDELGDGVPDWENEDIDEVFPALNPTVGNAAPEAPAAQARARGWADVASGTKEALLAPEQFPTLGGGAAPSVLSWGPNRKPSEGTSRPGAAPAAKSKGGIDPEAFPSLGGAPASVSENTSWGPSTAKESKESPGVRETTLEDWVKTKPKAAQPKEFDAAGADPEAFPSLGGSSKAAPVPQWGARNPTVGRSTAAARIKELKEAKMEAAAKEAAEAIAQSSKSNEPPEKVEDIAKDADSFPELPSSQPPPKAPQAKKAPKVAAKPKLSKPSSSAPEVRGEEAPLHLDKDLVLLKKGEEDEPQEKEGSQKKKKGQNKKNVIPASEWFQG
ncbi:unnamed protein product [Effrenium voratum]|nr:unnamed protein product [Effrenium voratum]